jgi:hypothetical protein
MSYYGNEIDRKLDDYFSSLKESVQEVASTYFKLGRDVRIFKQANKLQREAI